MQKLLLPFIFLLPFQLLAQHDDVAEVIFEIRKQQDCWNNADLECFMQGYWKSDSLMFIGKNGVNYGWQTTFDNYKRSYPDAAAMGELAFKIISTNMLSKDAIFIVGQWTLKRESGDLGGHFSLLWKKIEGRWVIVADHTS